MPCRCQPRKDAESQGTFVRAPALGCWVDTARDKAIRRDGFGYRWQECPWCRGDMPEVPRQQSATGDTWTAWGGE